MAVDLADVALEAHERTARDGDLVTAYVALAHAHGMVAVHERQEPVAFLTSEREERVLLVAQQTNGHGHARQLPIESLGVIGHEEQVPREQQPLHQAPFAADLPHDLVFGHEAVLHDGGRYQTAAHLERRGLTTRLHLRHVPHACSFPSHMSNRSVKRKEDE